jgi:hypothetical protein
MHYYGSVERTQIDEFYTVRTGLPQFYSSVHSIVAPVCTATGSMLMSIG